LSSIRLVKQIPQPALRERKKKNSSKAKTSGLRFCPLPEQKPPDALSPFIESIYASQDI
jgi:hypothetical protein